MRKVEFRGKLYSGEWVYGNLTVLTVRYQNISPGSYISNNAGKPFAFCVQPETVGQYIGLRDKNNKRIYEGDILQMFRLSDITGKHEPNKVWKDGEYHEDIRTVQFNMGTFYTFNNHDIEIAFMHLARPGESFAVIGDIHTAD